ncbi:MAG: alpha/beta fold hydrolase [Gammaproteobacteria bacterium]|nr:alpha/beta fold hydrolase [Gammaproteobacteria bacterium]
METEAFSPRGIWRNGDIQSIVSSLPLRRSFVERRARKLTSMSRVEILHCANNVRLKCLRTAQPGQTAPVAVLIHGWLGSADSLYMLSAASELYNAGFEVWRLQLRDHGDTHDLNQGIFHSCLIDEVVDAIGQIQKLIGGRKLCLGGFSLGGNFSLRVAARATEAQLDIAQVIAICPVLHPPATLDALEDGPRIYNYYFMRKWRRALRLKHQSWPDHYNIDEIENQQSMRGLTEHLVTEYSHFDDLMTYLNGYSITGDALSSVAVPTLLLVSRDDPIIPIAHIEKLAKPDSLTVHVSRYGGHCGFLTNPFAAGWADKLMVRTFLDAHGLKLNQTAINSRSNAA